MTDVHSQKGWCLGPVLSSCADLFVICATVCASNITCYSTGSWREALLLLKTFNLCPLPDLQEREKEAARCVNEDGTMKRHEDGKAMSQRPDLSAANKIKGENRRLTEKKFVGHFPGLNISDRWTSWWHGSMSCGSPVYCLSPHTICTRASFSGLYLMPIVEVSVVQLDLHSTPMVHHSLPCSFYARAEMSTLGMHFPPVAGIDYVGGGSDDRHLLAASRGVRFATSIMVAGCYKDDSDDGHELWYTGDEHALAASPACVAGSSLLGLAVFPAVWLPRLM